MLLIKAFSISTAHKNEINEIAVLYNSMRTLVLKITCILKKT